MHNLHRQIVQSLAAALYDLDLSVFRKRLHEHAPEARFHQCHPFGTLEGPDAIVDTLYQPLIQAIPDLERRDWIVMAGATPEGDDWVGCGGHLAGTFSKSWLDIPPTGHIVHMRFHEFWRFSEQRIVEYQCLWDIPEIMMQAGAWPMAPSLGREMWVPGPADGSGLLSGEPDAAQAESSCRHIIKMLEYLKLHPSQGGPEVMEMERFWHPKMMWYGPAGIGSARGIEGFRNWHQIPFLNAMPDRGQYVDKLTYHFFGEENYAAVTGWPNMLQTVSNDGWLGIAPNNKCIEMRSLDFWRLENGLIRENWVLVDLLHAFHQLGVDVFARLREFNKARTGAVFVDN